MYRLHAACTHETTVQERVYILRRVVLKGHCRDWSGYYINALAFSHTDTEIDLPVQLLSKQNRARHLTNIGEYCACAIANSASGKQIIFSSLSNKIIIYCRFSLHYQKVLASLSSLVVSTTIRLSWRRPPRSH